MRDYKITKPIRLIELFGGVGCQATALRYLGANFEHYKLCEFDKYAIETYNNIHNTNFSTSDIKKVKANDLEIVDKDKYEYIMTYSFPCTNLSLAGKRQGMERDSNTSSSLLWEVERLLKECKELPQILLMENVIQIHNKTNISNFQEWQLFLKSLGYTNFWQDLNAKDYDIPQSRNRTFMISILNNDVNYIFPKKMSLNKCLNDMLEDNVDEKYYLSKDKIERIMKWRAQQDPFKDINISKEICPTLTARGAGEEHSGMILINEAVQYKDYTTYKMNKNIISKKGIARTLTTSCGEPGKDGCYLINENEKEINNRDKELKIRKLTPRECFRVMGFKDIDIDKITVSRRQQYKQAGNGIVINVLMEIFKELIKENK